MVKEPILDNKVVLLEMMTREDVCSGWEDNVPRAVRGMSFPPPALLFGEVGRHFGATRDTPGRKKRPASKCRVEMISRKEFYGTIIT